MKFEEIFKEEGLYVADSFAKGFCFEVKEGFLYAKTYRNKSDLHPIRIHQPMYSGLLLKDYKKVLTISSLFNK